MEKIFSELKKNNISKQINQKQEKWTQTPSKISMMKLH
jgi:hypothetical protein